MNETLMTPEELASKTKLILLWRSVNGPGVLEFLTTMIPPDSSAVGFGHHRGYGRCARYRLQPLSGREVYE